MPFFGVPIRNGLPIGLGSVAGFGVQQFDPSQLFEGGTVAGAWYDPSDLTTMFDTSTGTTPVAMPGLGSAVSVGLMLDKSQGLVLGPELVTNGDFSSGTTGWTADRGGSLSVVSGSLRVTQGAVTDFALGYQAVTLVIGQWYKLTVDFVGGTATAVQVGVGTSFTSSDATFFSNATSPRTLTVYFAATATTMYVRGSVNVTTNNVYADFDNFSLKALPGNHAISFNNTTARPELRARVNLLVATATLSTQSVTTQATSYTLSFAGAGSITLSGTATGSYSAGTHTITCTAGTLTLTVSGTVTTADLRPANSGALLPAYQAVVDANTYDTSGFPLYLRFDGIDDSMYTPANLNLSGTDKVAVFAGVRKLSDAAQGIITELSAAWAINNGTFTVQGPVSAAPNYYFGGKGDAVFNSNQTVEATTFTAPITNILACSYNISGDLVSPRINGAATSAATGDQGSGNFGNYPLNIGVRSAASLPLAYFNGHLHGLIVVGSAVSAGNISATESWMAGKTGLQL